MLPGNRFAASSVARCQSFGSVGGPIPLDQGKRRRQVIGVGLEAALEIVRGRVRPRAAQALRMRLRQIGQVAQHHR